jgi:hypothetical protein
VARDREPAPHRRRHLRDQGRVSRSGRTFAAQAVPSFRLYLAGQAVSLTGTWMQVVAQPSPAMTCPQHATVHHQAGLSVRLTVGFADR